MKKLKLIFVSILFIVTLGMLITSVWPNFQKDVNLPKPNLAGEYTADSVIEYQLIADELISKNVTLDEISQILWGMQGITRGSGFRTAPSASAISPMELFVVHGGVSDLKKGFYKYLPKQNSLEIISTKSDLPSNLIQENSKLMSSLNNIDTFIIIAGSYDQTVQSYGERGYLYVDLEVGHIIDNAILQLVALNSITNPIYNFQQLELQQHFDITKKPFVILPIGDLSNQVQLNQIKTTDNKSFEEALSNRRSTRDYLEGFIPLGDITELLELSFNNSFSINISQNLEFHLIAENVDGLESGLYLVNFATDNQFGKSLLVLQKSGFLLDTLKSSTISGAAIDRAQAALVISMKQNDLELQSSNPFLYRKKIYEIGLVTQNFLIKCSELGLGTVTIGGFEPSKVAQVLNKTGEIEPVYIMPIGITPEYAGEKPGIELTKIGKLLGFVSFGIFVLVYFATLKPIRKFLGKKYRQLHIYLGILSVVFMNIHYLIMHGQVKTILNLINPVSYVNGVIHFFQFGFHIPLGKPDFGYFSANIAILFMNLTILTGIMLLFKSIKKRRLILKIHKIIVNIVLLFMIFHIFLNSIVFGSNPNMFLLINALIFEVYLLIRIINK